ncbi:Sugar transport protein 10, partial [Phytophthora cinnamomi]|uniref:Sugar transport protein 10 n=1 Tax=Phytophthora cinnamomi TaxID=4785 RepID=UPI00355A8EF1
MQMTVVTGLFLANVVNIIVENRDNGWRTTNGVAMAAPIVVMLGIFFVPESPRWTYLHKGKEEAERVLKRLRQTDNVGHELEVIGDQVAEELAAQKGLVELLEPSIFKRVAIAMMLQVLQQATGINPIMSYGALIFKDITNAGIYAAFFLSGVNFLSTIPAMRWVDTFGRRQLLLIGAVGMVIGHLFAAILFTAICNGNVDNAGCPKVGGWFICVGSAFFVFNFAISWGPVCWIYPAEIFPLGVRAGRGAMTVVTGLFLANVVNIIVENRDNGWRTTNGVAMAAPIVVMLGIFFVPESPRWTYLHKGKEEAERVLKRLRQTDNVGHELEVIGDQVAEELAAQKGLVELLEPSIFKRVAIAMMLQVLQQATGINPIMSYGALIFKDITNAGIYAAFFLSGVNFLSTIPAMRWVDTFGRRQLLLIGAVGM